MSRRTPATAGGITTTATRGHQNKTPRVGVFCRGEDTRDGYLTRRGVTLLGDEGYAPLAVRWFGEGGYAPRELPRRRWGPKAGITSRANQRSCSLKSAGGMPSAQWIIIWSSPGYRASNSRMPSMTREGGPHSHAFWSTPSRRVGTRA